MTNSRRTDISEPQACRFQSLQSIDRRFVNCSRIFQHFFDRRVAVENAAQAILAQGDHAELDRFLFQDDRGRALVDQLPDRDR